MIRYRVQSNGPPGEWVIAYQDDEDDGRRGFIDAVYSTRDEARAVARKMNDRQRMEREK